MADVMGQDFSEAPKAIAAQAEEAKQAAREALAVSQTSIEDTTAARALAEINEFYRLVREQVRLRREQEDDEDEDDFILLVA